MLKDSMWITSEQNFGEICPEFIKTIQIGNRLKKAEISITATGVYEAFINGKRVGNFIMAPGWTNYAKRLQFQTYDITKLLYNGENNLSVIVGNGWYRGGATREKDHIISTTPNIIAEIILDYGDKKEVIRTDLSWQVKRSKVLFSDIYNGEIYDANAEDVPSGVKYVMNSKAVLIENESELVCEQETIEPVKEFISPKGERIIDFGQEITGYIEVETEAQKGEEVVLSFAEALDSNGNFYTENYRSAKCIYQYKCRDGKQSYKPHTTFYGFRYIRVDTAPKNTEFTAIVVHSDIKRTGWLKTKHNKLNKLFENIIWGQKCNFLDVPTDCPQRDERLGWTGDAEVFAKTAAYQYDVKKFFTKWLEDMMSEQRFDGMIPNTVPNSLSCNEITANASPAWGDAAVIIPWVLYEMYGDKELLKRHFPMMQGWISYIEGTTLEENLWIGHEGFGDWLGLDAEENSYTGITDKDFIASAYYKYSASIVAKAAEILDENYQYYEEKVKKSREAFIKRFPECHTQTEYVLALHFDLTDKKSEFAAKLAKMIEQNGNCLTTGFVGTPYLLFALADNGFTKTAYDLLLQEKFPSWLYSVNQGATTVWEHWDSIKEDGSFWPADMNSLNHYAYGSVAEWVFSRAAGIRITEKGLEITPVPDKRLGSMEAEYNSIYGKIKSSWHYEGDEVFYEIEIPVNCNVTVNGKTEFKEKGKYRGNAVTLRKTN